MDDFQTMNVENIADKAVPSKNTNKLIRVIVETKKTSQFICICLHIAEQY